MRRRHVMPFGAQCDGTRAMRFRLWAPAARDVELCLEAPPPSAVLPMADVGAGWFELATPAAGPGTRYRYRIDRKQLVPDPASRSNPQDVHGASEVIDPTAYEWHDEYWRGRPWHEAVLYELHVGTFTPGGTFEAAIERLPYLRDLGVTAVELMPVADFPGARNWGYDGVLPFAPDSRYGRPDDLKRLVDEAHQLGLMVLLDVVYNHFGPDGNYLHVYAPDFFSRRHQTPWGAAINFDGPGSRVVRDFFIHNALYWLEEFHLDGLRLDAVHAILDESRPDMLTELAAAVRRGPAHARHVHLVLENDNNAARYLERDPRGAPSEGGTGAGVTLSRGPTCGDATVEPAMGAPPPALRAPAGSDPLRGPSSALGRAPSGDVTPETDATPALDGAAPDSRPVASRKREPCSLLAGAARWYDAQWNDDVHHALHVLLTGERDGYYADYLGEPARHLGRALAEGYAYQGEESVFRGRPRGESSRYLPPAAFIVFLQNHDQVGNRAFGERLTMLAAPEALHAGLALVLLAPSVPLLFMGEEFGCTQPFAFFCDFTGDLARAVAEGRRNEFRAFARFKDPAAAATIPDPNAAATCATACLDWSRLAAPPHAAQLHFVRELLETRRREIIPRLPGLVAGSGAFTVTGRAALRVEWECADGTRLALAANLGDEAVDDPTPFDGDVLYACPGHAGQAIVRGRHAPWSVVWAVRPGVHR